MEEENMGLREAEKETSNYMVEEYLAQEMLLKEEQNKDLKNLVQSLRPKV